MASRAVPTVRGAFLLESIMTEADLSWIASPPTTAGLFCWTLLGDYCLFHVTDRGDGQLAVMPNILPITEYDGSWIGPFPPAPKDVIADRVFRDGTWRIATHATPPLADKVGQSLGPLVDTDGVCSNDCERNPQAHPHPPDLKPFGRIQRDFLGTVPVPNSDRRQEDHPGNETTRADRAC